MLIENVEYEIDPMFETILTRNITKKGINYQIKINDKEINFNINFRIFLTTKIANPHHMPDLLIQVTMINFVVTLEGLEE